jgi:hypothetical protein
VLSLTNPTAADTGDDDVVVSEGEVVEPSSLAHVTLGGVTGVDPPPSPGRNVFTLGSAAPNLSASPMSFGYAAERPLAMTGSIHDVSGHPVVPGVYFPRVRVDGETHVQRIVRLP